ncbi:hypothetical protein F4778DRAFT_362577 [Xylariomycetidae sp. FL2044]|nr:hypothetical protein F4778DRAFT_362577 [Xylariomycetidae sp. FL2044]
MDASDNQPGPLPGPERGGDGDGDEHHTVPQDSASAPRQRLYKSILERTRPVQTDALSYTRNRASDYIYFCRSNFRAAHSSMPRHLQAEHQLVLYHNVWHHVTFQFSEWPAGQSLSRVTDATKLNLSAAGVAGTLLNLPSSQECLNALFYELGNNYLGLDPSMGHPRGTAAGHRIRCDVVFKNNIDALSYTAASVVNNEGGGMCCLNNRVSPIEREKPWGRGLKHF